MKAPNFRIHGGLLVGTVVAGGLMPLPSMGQEQCLSDAWDAYNDESYAAAIAAADRCLDDFSGTAARIQRELEVAEVPAPPTGRVDNDDERQKIFERGVLNDVATALFLRGRSAEHLYRRGGSSAEHYRELAEKSYVEACEYKHGRTWDPRGWFWSPCEAASDRLPLGGR